MEIIKKKDICNVCRDVKSKVLHHDSSFIYNICKNCGHVFQSNRRPEEFYLSLPYTVAESKVDRVDFFKYDAHTRNRGNYIYEFIQKYVSSDYCSSILDVGSGFGGVGYYLNKHLKAKRVVGVTPDYNPKTFTHYLGIDFIKFNYNQPIKGKYDVIIMTHVLEHFIEPLQALKAARENITSKGILYVEVPSFQWEGARHRPIFTPVHISYFSKSSLQNLLEFAGFKIVKVKESKYWGSIKIVAIPDKKQKTLIAHKENWKLKILSWKAKNYLLYYIVNLYKKFIHVKPND